MIHFLHAFALTDNKTNIVQLPSGDWRAFDAYPVRQLSFTDLREFNECVWTGRTLTAMELDGYGLTKLGGNL